MTKFCAYLGKQVIETTIVKKKEITPLTKKERKFFRTQQLVTHEKRNL